MSLNPTLLIVLAAASVVLVVVCGIQIDNGRTGRWKVAFSVGVAGVLLALAGGIQYGMDAESKRADAIDRKITAQIKANERYQNGVIAVLRSKTGLQPLSADVRDVPSRDNQTATGVRMESGDELVVCVLNTRTGPASVTSHCAPLDAAQR